MDYSFFIWSTASFIETRLKEPIQYNELEKTVGFSYRHIRETFRECTGVSLSRYILIRRLANSAFDIVHTGKSLTDIASDYMFESYDTFTRAFKRHTRYLPSDFRSSLIPVRVGRRRILIGMFGPMIINNGDSSCPWEENWLIGSDCPQPQKTEGEKIMKNIEKTNQSCILYGVPKVSYSFEECTPFCVALKACLNYMGQQIDYAYIMAASGASFRLRWNIAFWDGGNVDIRNIYEDRDEAFRRAFQAAGRSYRILNREDSDKEEFIKFIKSEIDEGRPVIALGIIGPPEACLITGYRDNGDTLLGWNCFQENQEFAKNVTIDESGYFVTQAWWENEYTLALMSVGEKQEQTASYKELLNNALDILTKPKITFYAEDGKAASEYAGGQFAYELWAKRVSDDKEFSKNAVLPILFERIMCQNDAQCMVGEGRSYAACLLERIGQEKEQVLGQCRLAAEYFRKAAECTFQMNECKGGFMQDEAAARKFAEPEARKQIVVLINKAKDYETRAVELIKEIVELL
jgi:AraC-like DNA-binding protein